MFSKKSTCASPVALEDAVDPVVSRGRFATLVLVSTGENLREWIFYNAALTDLDAPAVPDHTMSS
jgi:hypothetical protein